MVPGISVASESIEAFNSDITISNDGTFTVTETIVYDFGHDQRHGIFRVIPLEHNQKASAWYKKRYIDISVTDIEVDGKQVQYEENISGTEIMLKIGDPKMRVTGAHIYTLRYKVSGALSYLDEDTVELYWNITGKQWPVGMQNITAVVQGPEASFGTKQFCYSGYEETGLPCTITHTGKDTVTFKVDSLQQGFEVTVAQSLNADLIRKNIIEKVPIYFSFIPLLMLLVSLLLYKGFKIRTKHNPRATIISQYEPYPGLLPMYTGVIFNGKLDSRDITAGIVYLAQQGFLKIKKTEKKAFFFFEVDDYEMTLLRPYQELPTLFHKEILSLLFSKQLVGEVMSLGNLKHNTSKQKVNFQTMQVLKKSIQKDLITKEFFEQPALFTRGHVLPTVVALAVLGCIVYFLAGDTGLYVGIGTTLFAGVIYMVMISRRRTKKGYDAQNHCKGFKEFLSVTDKERFAFHNAPEKSPEQFMQYLPYAIALGVEKKWAEVFQDIPLQDPDWYESATGSSFTALAFSRDIGAFSSALVTSSGTSPSSGGGSAGGGSGGGGGGSW